jgi:hypothetical protein
VPVRLVFSFACFSSFGLGFSWICCFVHPSFSFSQCCASALCSFLALRIVFQLDGFLATQRLFAKVAVLQLHACRYALIFHVLHASSCPCLRPLFF